jgi:hypothetical protein
VRSSGAINRSAYVKMAETSEITLRVPRPELTGTGRPEFVCCVELLMKYQQLLLRLLVGIMVTCANNKILLPQIKI